MKTSQRQFQFRLADLLLLVLMYGAFCAIVLPYFYAERYAYFDLSSTYPKIAGIKWRSLAAFIVVAGSVGFFVGVAVAVGIAHHLRVRKILCYVVAAIFGVAMGLGFAWPDSPFLRSRLAADDDPGAFYKLKEFCTAQDIYRRTDYNNDGILEYATTFNGQFGLADLTIALVDSRFGAAIYGESKPLVPYYGYMFKILTAQGPHAMGGKRSFLTYDAAKRPHMTHGYALVAAPVVYGGHYFSRTFMISNEGTIYECDFGPQTSEVFEKMTEYDPDPAFWVIAD